MRMKKSPSRVPPLLPLQSRHLKDHGGSVSSVLLTRRSALLIELCACFSLHVQEGHGSHLPLRSLSPISLPSARPLTPSKRSKSSRLLHAALGRPPPPPPPPPQLFFHTILLFSTVFFWVFLCLDDISSCLGSALRAHVRFVELVALSPR